MIWSTDPSKNVSKIQKIFHDKAVQSIILWLNLNKIGGISKSVHKQGKPLIPLSCAGLKTQIPMHSNSLGCPKIFPLSASFCTGYRLSLIHI